MNLKKIVFTHGGGRFGNQLINYIHLIAFGLEYKNTSIKQYSLYRYLTPKNGQFIVLNGAMTSLSIVEREKRNNYINFIIRIIVNSRIRILHFMGYFFYGQESLIIGESGNNIGYLFGNKINNLTLNKDLLDSLKETTLLAGWSFRNWSLVDKWKEEISQNLLTILKQDNENIQRSSIGVHIRGTDFIEHANGHLYFNDKHWISAVEIIEKQFNISQVIFMADELKDWNKIINGHEGWTVSIGSVGGNGSMYDSFSDLLKCDYILTAGSTFALMAAWLTNARVLDVSDIATGISIKAMKYDEWSKHDNFLLNWK